LSDITAAATAMNESPYAAAPERTKGELCTSRNIAAKRALLPEKKIAQTKTIIYNHRGGSPMTSTHTSAPRAHTPTMRGNNNNNALHRCWLGGYFLSCIKCDTLWTSRVSGYWLWRYWEPFFIDISAAVPPRFTTFCEIIMGHDATSPAASSTKNMPHAAAYSYIHTCMHVFYSQRAINCATVIIRRAAYIPGAPTAENVHDAMHITHNAQGAVGKMCIKLHPTVRGARKKHFLIIYVIPNYTRPVFPTPNAASKRINKSFEDDGRKEKAKERTTFQFWPREKGAAVFFPSSKKGRINVCRELVCACFFSRPLPSLSIAFIYINIERNSSTWNSNERGIWANFVQVFKGALLVRMVICAAREIE
jgi:hypothetical protein